MDTNKLKSVIYPIWDKKNQIDLDVVRYIPTSTNKYEKHRITTKLVLDYLKGDGESKFSQNKEYIVNDTFTFKGEKHKIKLTFYVVDTLIKYDGNDYLLNMEILVNLDSTWIDDKMNLRAFLNKKYLVDWDMFRYAILMPIISEYFYKIFNEENIPIEIDDIIIFLEGDGGYNYELEKTLVNEISTIKKQMNIIK
jgi:hypothetical protein